MIFFRRLLSFLVILLITLYIGYFSYLNTDMIFISVPGLGEQTVSKAIGFLLSFATGAVFTCLFFGLEFMKKALELRSVKKELKRSHPVESKSSFFSKKAEEPKKEEETIISEPSLDDLSTDD